MVVANGDATAPWWQLGSVVASARSREAPMGCSMSSWERNTEKNRENRKIKQGKRWDKGVRIIEWKLLVQLDAIGTIE